MDCLGRTELEVFMEVFDDLGDLDDDAFIVCSCCGKKVWNRGDMLCKRCLKRRLNQYKQLLGLYTKRALGSKCVEGCDEESYGTSNRA